jgi:Protein of unknown function (DUF3575)
MRYFAVLLVLVISCAGYAQSPAPPNKFSIYFCPLAAADIFSFPTIQAGLEWRFRGHFSWYNELGVEYIRTFVDLADTAILRPRGIKVKTELRYYFRREHYLAFNAFLTSDVHNTQLSYLDNRDTSMLRADAFGVRKQVYGWNVVYGVERPLGKRFWLDWYVGLGWRSRDVHPVGEEYNYSRDRMLRSIDLNVADIRADVDSRGGVSVAPNLTAGVRVVYRLP